jgi:hypothetical protein
MPSVESFVACGFVEYLADCLEIGPDQRPSSGQWSRIGNTIGALALRLNLLSEADVDKVLEIQDARGGYFGEIAIEREFLTPAQVDRLLDVQKLHDDLNLGEQLVVDGRLDLPSLVNMLGQYMREQGDTTAGTR